jgi:hypothetical protein
LMLVEFFILFKFSFLDYRVPLERFAIVFFKNIK